MFITYYIMDTFMVFSIKFSVSLFKNHDIPPKKEAAISKLYL